MGVGLLSCLPRECSDSMRGSEYSCPSLSIAAPVPAVLLHTPSLPGHLQLSSASRSNPPRSGHRGRRHKLEEAGTVASSEFTGRLVSGAGSAKGPCWQSACITG